MLKPGFFGNLNGLLEKYHSPLRVKLSKINTHSLSNGNLEFLNLKNYINENSCKSCDTESKTLLILLGYLIDKKNRYSDLI